MKNNKANFYNWILVTLENIVFILFLIITGIFFERYSITLLTIGVFFSVTIIPTFISKLDTKSKNFISYGVPIILIATSIFFYWQSLNYVFIPKSSYHFSFYALEKQLNAIASLISFMFFTSHYLIGIYSKKGELKKIALVVLILIILILIPMLFLFL